MVAPLIKFITLVEDYKTGSELAICVTEPRVASTRRTAGGMSVVPLA